MELPTPRHIAFDAVGAARQVAVAASRRSNALDHHGSFPFEDIRALAEAGLLAAPIPASEGGAGLGEEPGFRSLFQVLRLIGFGNLSLGRLYEGHVNALQLIARYGDATQKRDLFADAAEGHLFGVWNTEPAQGGLRLWETSSGIQLKGVKILASGAGSVARPLVTARRLRDDRPVMLVISLETGSRADVSSWRALGMRSSATGTVDFSGLIVPLSVMIGQPDDYHREPHFSAGAWRFAAVQLGGIEAVFDAWRQDVHSTNRGHDPHQLGRLGQGAMAVETARHWVERAAAIVAADALAASRIIAFVNFARLAVERSGLDVFQLSQRSVGLRALLEGHPLDQRSRDLATYLRQPAPDKAMTAAATEVLAATETIGSLWER